MSQPWRKLRAHFVSLKFPQLSYGLEAPDFKASGLLSAVTKVFREAGRDRSLAVLSLAALSLGLVASAAKAQMVIIFPSATGHITQENPLVDGMIHLILTNCGWTC